MPLLASKLGIRLLLLLGKTVPTPASADVMTSLQHVEVANNADGEDGFRLVFTLSKDKKGEFGLVRSGAVDPDTRVLVGVLVGAKLYPLADGIIFHEQLVPGQDPATFNLTVMGRSIQVRLDLEEKDQTFPDQSASAIVHKILSGYRTYGIADLAGVQPTSETPSDKERIPSQHETDLAYLRKLAKQNGFVFYLEPKTLGTTAAYFGPRDRARNSLPDLCVNLGPATNVTSMQFSQDPMAPLSVKGSIIDPFTKRSLEIPAPPSIPGLSVARPVAVRRKMRLRSGARLGPAAARDAAAAQEASTPDPVEAKGTLDTLRYGDVLRAHRTVTVRGAGRSYDGDYIVSQVTHQIEVGKYIQSFTLSRAGLEAPI